jgi:hypothetical protein
VRCGDRLRLAQGGRGGGDLGLRVLQLDERAGLPLAQALLAAQLELRRLELHARIVGAGPEDGALRLAVLRIDPGALDPSRRDLDPDLGDGDRGLRLRAARPKPSESRRGFNRQI